MNVSGVEVMSMIVAQKFWMEIVLYIACDFDYSKCELGTQGLSSKGRRMPHMLANFGGEHIYLGVGSQTLVFLPSNMT